MEENKKLHGTTTMWGACLLPYTAKVTTQSVVDTVDRTATSVLQITIPSYTNTPTCLSSEVSRPPEMVPSSTRLFRNVAGQSKQDSTLELPRSL